MSKLKIYSIRDNRTEAFLRPFFLQNDSVLDRAMIDAVNDPQSQLHQHPQDFAVYDLGEFDEQTGQITQCPPTHKYNLVQINAQVPEAE